MGVAWKDCVLALVIHIGCIGFTGFWVPLRFAFGALWVLKDDVF